MSGGPPHHPHSRQAPAANTAWNHLQVPNFFPTRQPQHAHMSNEHSILHQPTWHTPTTEPLKPHSHIFGLEQMLSDRQYARHTPGVDLSLARNGGQNGDLPQSPISLSVRDTNKINSLPASALEIEPVEVGKCHSPGGLKSVSPGLIVGAVAAAAPAVAVVPSVDAKKRSSKRVDSILERLNPNLVEKVLDDEEKPKSVIVQASSHDENSNSSSLNVPTPTNVRDDDDVVSPFSNEDSLDSNKSRRKRKPCKTVRVATKDDDKPKEGDDVPKVLPDSNQSITPEIICLPKNDEKIVEDKVIIERRRSSNDLESAIPAKMRRKTSSESETIDDIAAMVQEGLKDKTLEVREDSKPIISVSVIKSKDSNLSETLNSENSETVSNSTNVHTTMVTPAQKKANTNFVEVENKLEEMFAGIEDTSDPIKTENSEDQSVNVLKSDVASTSQDNVTSTSNEPIKKLFKKGKRRGRGISRRDSENNSIESTPTKKRTNKQRLKGEVKLGRKSKKSLNGKQVNSKIDTIKDVYAYDSGSNASSSKSRGPFIQIRGPRDSPLSVNVINTPTNDDDSDKKPGKTKKFHDDSEYRHKVRSRGLHSSTLSNQYDAQTKDATWICAFCKRGPHATEITGPTLNGNIAAPGDLFGPYFITTNSPEFERRLDDPYDRQFKSKKIAKVLDGIIIPKGKKKRKHSIDSGEDLDIYRGITDTGNRTFEVWAHEDCIVWSPGTYLVGPKIVGLEEAVWTSCNVVCAKCHLKGANICCLKRSCINVMHVCCARLTNWQFDEDNFKAYCPEHKIP